VLQAGGDARLGWEVSDSATFQRVLRKGEAVARAVNDYCVKVDARGLPAGQKLFYRFLAQTSSVTGETRTAPRRGGDGLKLALFSCSNLPFGYFNAYAHAAAREDIDLCVHVGDYIYEYPRGTYPSATEALPDRIINPEGEIIKGSDYTARYASYRTDPDLQELHRVKPWITVWDDHELTNDAWKNGAQNHQPETEGDWVTRRLAAARAYDQWLPTRPTSGGPLQIYRSLSWGNVAEIFALDARSIGRDQQLDYRKDLGPAAAEGGAKLAAAIEAFKTEKLNAPERSLLGAAQENWLARGMRAGKARGATWSVLAQQVIMGQQVFAPQLGAMLSQDAPAFRKQWAMMGAQLGAAGLEWNLDSWGGYPAARRRFLETSAAIGANTIVLSGDSHNAWVNALPGGKDGRMAAIEVAGASVTSPGMENTFTAATPGAREAAMLGANPNMAACDLTNRGYAAVTLTPTKARVDLLAVSDIRTRSNMASISATYEAEAGATGPSGWVKV
jgi:alkaline phosphatase D